jgi:protein involved in polysaccharide export with SLBB domain
MNNTEFKYKLKMPAAQVLSLFILIASFGCAGNKGVILQSGDIVTMNSKNDSETYMLGAGDKIAVKFFYNDKLNERVTIRPDGRISLQLVGEVKAAGFTPADLNSLLTEKYAGLLESTNVTVIVEEVVSQKIYIGGEVGRPGVVPINGKLRILDSVMLAGGELDTAELQNVVLIRYNGSQKPDIYSINLKKIINGQMPDINLRPYDIVYLPKTAIAKVDLFVRQYIYNLLPSQVLFSFPYNLNPETQVEVK